MKLARKVSIIEQTNDQVTVCELASSGIGAGFFAFAIGAVLFVANSAHENGQLIVGSLVTVWFCLLGLYCCVESRFGVSRGGGFWIKRSLFGLEKTKKYPLEKVCGVVHQETLKGNGLQLQLASGRKKGLTMSLHYQYMGDEALALDSAIRAFKKRSRADHRVREERGG